MLWEAARYDASPLKWGVEVLLATHCARSMVYLSLQGLQKGKPSSPTWRLQREPPFGFGSGELTCKPMLLGEKGLINPGWVA